MLHRNLTALLFLAISLTANAQIEPMQFGDFESWATREVKESGLIGGKQKTIYVIGPKASFTTQELAPYNYKKNTIWTSSNVYAKVAGIVKASNTVIPEKRIIGGGTCCRMDTKLDGVKVLGMIDVHVLVSGSIFTGQTIEPIKGAGDPYCNLDFGIPFTRKPKALVLDYKCRISLNNYVEKWPGIGHKNIKGIQDKAEFWVYLQKRWEEPDGSIHALRIGTAREQLDHDELIWQNNHRVEIHYGDITKTDYYKDYMCLNGPYRALNSKGEVTPIIEDGWGNADDTPTHIIIMLTAGNQGAFIGTLGNTLWVDNVKLEY
ncbi:MAG: PCMD domain-containing protein [Paludibacteraceae bacterium]|nr:PCMD domain-containing protein [Paludibacteraceae bacterium]